MLRSQHADGGWGERESEPLSTALGVLAAGLVGGDMEERVEAGRSYLRATQAADGGWSACPFIAFPTSDGEGIHTYASRTATTAFCLKALARSETLAPRRVPVRQDERAPA